MNNYISEFNDKYKSETIAILEEVAKFYQDFDDMENETAFLELKKATEEGNFYITVVGEFSSGKSTFLNSLMGEKFLPSFSNETTATINFLRSVKESPTQKEMLKINYADGHVEMIDGVDGKTIEKYVSTKGLENGIDVAKQVSSVEIFYDSKFLNNGVCLVDSPGLNGMLENHETITNNQVKKSHAIIFMFKAEQPGSASEFKTLESLRKKSNSIFLILNKIDCINPDEQSVDDCIKTLINNYSKVFPNITSVPEIKPVAAYPALVARSKHNLSYHHKSNFTTEEKKELLEISRIEDFEERLMYFLTHKEKTKKQLLEPLEKIDSFLNDTKMHIDEDVKLLESKVSADDIQEKINALDEEVKGIEEKVKNIRANVFTDINTIIKKTTNAIIAGTKNICDNYFNRISNEEEIEDLEDNYQRYINQIQSEYFDVYNRELEEMEANFKQMIVSKFDKNIEGITNYLNQNVYSDGNDCPKLDIKIDTSIFNINYSLDDYKQKADAIISEMAKTGKDEDALDTQLIRAKRNKSELDDLKYERDRLEKLMKDQLIAIGPRPNINTLQGTEIDHAWEWFLFIPYHRIAIEKPYTKTDDTAQRNYDNICTEIREEYTIKIRAIEEKMASIPKDDIAEIESQKRQKAKQQQKLEKNLTEAKEEYLKNSAEARKRRAKKAKAYLQNVIDESLNKSRTALINSLKGYKTLMSEKAQFVIKNNLEDVFYKKRKELEDLKRLQESDIAEKEKVVIAKKAFYERASVLVEKAQSLSNKINSIETDTIKNQAI